MDIEKSKLLLVEGKDEIFFFKALCKILEVDGIQIIEAGGKDKFKKLLPVILNMRGFEIVDSIGIVRDADNSSDSAFDSISYHLQQNELEAPDSIGSFNDNGDDIATGIFIMPGNQDTGMLENLMLDTVADHPVKISSDKYINELKRKLTLDPPLFPKNEHKARLQAFLAGMEKSVPSLGMAAEKGYFDLNSVVLRDIKQFIIKLNQ